MILDRDEIKLAVTALLTTRQVIAKKAIITQQPSTRQQMERARKRIAEIDELIERLELEAADIDAMSAEAAYKAKWEEC